MSVVHWSITKGDFCDLEDADITCYQMLQDLLNLKIDMPSQVLR